MRKVKTGWWKRLEKLYPTQKKLADVLGHKATDKEIERDRKIKHPTLYFKTVRGKAVLWKPYTTRMLYHLKAGTRDPSEEIMKKARIKKDQMERYYFRLGSIYPDKTMKELKKMVKRQWREEKSWVGLYA